MKKLFVIILSLLFSPLFLNAETFTFNDGSFELDSMKWDILIKENYYSIPSNENDYFKINAKNRFNKVETLVLDAAYFYTNSSYIEIMIDVIDVDDIYNLSSKNQRDIKKWLKKLQNS